MPTFIDTLKSGRDSVVKTVGTQAAKFQNKEFLQACVAGSALIIAADGVIADEEVDAFIDFATTNPALSCFKSDQKIKLLNEYIELAKNKMGQATLLGNVSALKGKPAAETVAQVVLILASEDSDFAESEKKMAKRILRALGLNADEYLDE